MISSHKCARALLRGRSLSVINRRPKLLLFGYALWCACLYAGAFAQVPPAADSVCSQSNSFYEDGHFKVRRVVIQTPLGFLDSVQEQFAAIKSKLPLKEGEGFTVASYILAQDKLRAEYGALSPGERVRLVYIAPELKNCDSTTADPMLDAVFHVFTTEAISYLTSIFENQPDKITRSLAPGAASSDENRILPQIYTGYNASRQMFLGARTSFKSNGGLFNKMDIDASGSSQSAEAEMGLSGSRDFRTGLISHAEWRLGYQYSNIPASPIRLKEATVLAQLFGATRQLGGNGLILRFGTSVEGGNRQADLEGASTATSAVANARHGAIKMYLGGTANRGKQAWTASYGLQIGQAGEDVRVDYIKHILDSAYSVRWLPREHMPLRLDLQFNAGLIQSSSGRIPVAERFFGGNAQEDFIQGSDWRVRSSPLIRSFPQNRFNRVGAGLPIGGKNFVSANITIAQTVWNHPAVPDDVINDPQIGISLGGELSGSVQATVLSYITETPKFKDVIKKLDDINSILAQVDDEFKAILSKNPPQDVVDGIEGAQDDLDDTKDAIVALKTSPDMGQVRAIVVGFEGLSPSLIENVTSDIADIPADSTNADLDAQLEKVHSDAARLESLRSEAQKLYKEVRSLGSVDPKDIKEAADKLGDLSKTLDEIRKHIPQLPAGGPEEKAAGLIGKLNAFVSASMNAVNRVQSNMNSSDPDGPVIAKTNLELLSEGYGPSAPALLSAVQSYIGDLRSPLAELHLESEWEALNAQAGQLKNLQAALRDTLARVPMSEPQKKARSDVAYTGRVLDVVFRELNLIAVSPVVMFDAARIGPKISTGFGNMRYGMGGGVRFSLVTLDVTLGYSFNLNRHQGEGRGAFVFSMDIADLFR